jgi:membrane protease YdiL (CAAX protease family)
MSYPQGPGQPPGAPWPPPSTLSAGHPPNPPQQQWDHRVIAHPHPEPRSYPLMLRTWDYAWWKPLVGILTMVVGGLVVMPLLLLPVLAVAVAIQGGSGTFADRFAASASLDSVTPASMLYLNLSLASLTLVAIGIVRLVHRLRPRWLSSVLPGMRWKFFFACLGLSVVALVVSVVASQLVPDKSTGELGGDPNKLTGTLIATAIVILLTTPLQALGEEYAFRGYLMQAFGSLTDAIATSLGIQRVWASRIASTIALLVTSGLFALAHGAQNFPLFFDRFAFGLIAGLIVILVGGLEAGIALHVLNNLLAFAVAIFFGDLQGALTVSEVSWWQLPVTVVQNGVFLLLVLLVARKMGLRRTTNPPPAQDVAQGVA